MANGTSGRAIARSIEVAVKITQALCGVSMQQPNFLFLWTFAEACFEKRSRLLEFA